MCKSRTSLSVRNFSFPTGKCEQFTAKALDCETNRPDQSQSKHLETARMKIEVDILAVPMTRTTTFMMTEGRPRPNLRSAWHACRYWTRVDHMAAFMLHCVCPPLPRRRLQLQQIVVIVNVRCPRWQPLQLMTMTIFVMTTLTNAKRTLTMTNAALRRQ